MPRAADSTADQPITRTVLFDARLRQVKDTDRVEIREIRILPGHAAGLHVHNGPVVGSILTGSVTYQIDGAGAVTWKRLGSGTTSSLASTRATRPGCSAWREETACGPGPAWRAGPVRHTGAAAGSIGGEGGFP
jgi:hypothetical protein